MRVFTHYFSIHSFSLHDPPTSLLLKQGPEKWEWDENR